MGDDRWALICCSLTIDRGPKIATGLLEKVFHSNQMGKAALPIVSYVEQTGAGSGGDTAELPLSQMGTGQRLGVLLTEDGHGPVTSPPRWREYP